MTVKKRKVKPSPAKSAGKGARINGLLPKQAKFVAEYLISGNATKAALAAGYSAKTAHVIGQENLKKPAIASLLLDRQAKLDAEQGERLAQMGLTRERVELEIARLAFFDARLMFKEDGTPRPITELSDNIAAGIVGLEVFEEFSGTGKDRVLIGHVKKYKIADKNSALDKAAKILGMYEKDNAQPGAAIAQAIHSSGLVAAKAAFLKQLAR